VSSTGSVGGGRPLLRGRVFGFPVHLDLSFVIVMAVLGWYPGVTLIDMVLWLLITPVAVLVHELGHAVLARTAGARPEIALAGFGGVTTYVPPRPLSRARSLAISLAGPVVGLALGVLLIAVRQVVADGLDPLGWAYSAIRIGIWTCIAWSLLNLLPILPLDGGQAMRELLPGAPAVRERRAAAVSVVVAGVAAVFAYLYTSLFLALFLVFFAVSNVLALRQASGRGAGGRPGPAPPQQAVLDLLWQNQAAEARRLLESLPPSDSTDLALHGAVLSLSGDQADRAQGHALLDQEFQRRPDDRNVAALLTLTLGLEHDWDRLIAVLQGPAAANVPPPVVERVIEEARGIGREDVAGRLTLMSQQPPG
jgi:Zn-dependent protease